MEELLKDTDPATGPTFSLSNRALRAVWGVVWTLFFLPSPRPAHGWRAMLLRLFGARLGKGVHVYAKVKVWAPWNLTIDDEAGVADGCEIYNIAPIHIGRRAVVSQGAYLCTGSHDYEDPKFQLIASPITVGAFAWICAEAFVGPGVKVGDGTVIGARAVVTKDMPDWMVCAGHPCKPLKPRNMRGELPA